MTPPATNGKLDPLPFYEYDIELVWPCPQNMIWSQAEKADPDKRRCEVCKQVCREKVHRVFEATRVRNFCSKECYDNA